MSTRETLKQIIEEVLGKMGFEGEVVIEETLQDNRRTLGAKIKTEDANILIGKDARHLSALETIIKGIFKGSSVFKEDPVALHIDINGYRSNRGTQLERLAQFSASQARFAGESVSLRPMNSFERRVVHMVVAKEGGVDSESAGEGRNRRVVIKPKIQDQNPTEDPLNDIKDMLE